MVKNTSAICWDESFKLKPPITKSQKTFCLDKKQDIQLKFWAPCSTVLTKKEQKKLFGKSQTLLMFIQRLTKLLIIKSKNNPPINVKSSNFIFSPKIKINTGFQHTSIQLNNLITVLKKLRIISLVNLFKKLC